MNINQYNPKGKLTVKHLLNIDDFDETNIYEVLHLARKIKSLSKVKEKYLPFQDETLGLMISSNNSRSRISFELAVKGLGGNTLYLSPHDVDFTKGMTYLDAITLLSRYGVKGMVVVVDNDKVKELGTVSPLPLINLKDSTNNPCQLLANLLTIWEKKGCLSGNTLSYLGNSLELSADTLKTYAKCGVTLTRASPKNLTIDTAELDNASQYGDILVTDDVYKAVANADFISSRFGNAEILSEEDKNSLKNYIVTNEVLNSAKPDTSFMHVFPVNHNEVSEEVIYGNRSIVFDQAENLIYVEKALMILLFK